VADKQTDGQTDMTDMQPVAYTALAKLALRRAVKTNARTEAKQYERGTQLELWYISREY